MIAFDPGALLPTDPAGGYVRASDVIADSFRMLTRIVEGEPARTDENETAFFMGPQK